MRNTRQRIEATSALLLAALLAMGAAAGCAEDGDAAAPSKGSRSDNDLEAGYAALSRGDLAAARASAEAFLAKHPHGTGAAEAYYLRGRTFEQAKIGPQRAAATVAANQRDARASYNAALHESTSAPLAGLVHAGLGNIAYFQDDPLAALSHYQAAYPELTDPEGRANCLMRIGQCECRLARFGAADDTFERVRHEYPNSPLAAIAMRYRGVRLFTVEFATYADARTAGESMALLRSQGLTPTENVDAVEHHIVSVVNVPTFEAAKQLKDRFAGQYPQALILP